MVVFDLDKTLRDIVDSAKYAPKGHQSRINIAWHDWQHYVNCHGKVIQPIANLLKTFGSDTVVLTSSQFGSSTWLYSNGLFPAEVIERAYDDERLPFDYKAEYIHLHQHEITLWVDDDDVVCDLVETYGIPTVRVKGY